MKRVFLLRIFVAVFALFFYIGANAQSFQSIMGIRLIVNNATVGGVKRFTYSSSSTTGGWGRALDSTWQNVPLVEASPDITACGSLNAVTGNSWVLIYRGNCEFGAKALAAQNVGAKGVIIVQNIAGAGPVGMGAGSVGNSVTIPVLMISKEDGDLIKAELDASHSVSISLTKWGFGATNDIAIVPSSIAAGPAGALPLTQLTSGTPGAYKYYTGAFVANTGTHPTANVKVKQEITFTPTGGSSSLIYSDSGVSAGVFNPNDSMVEVFSPRDFSHNVSQTGRYDLTYVASSDSADLNPADNIASTSVEVTPNLFCKGGIDPVKQNPKANIYYSLNSNPEFTWGPLFYVSKGGYKADRVKFLVSDNDTTRHSLPGFMNVYIYKWSDGANGGTVDGYMESKELTLKSIAGRDFNSLDSNAQPITVNCADSNGLPATIVLENNTWYWVAVDVPQGWFLGCDGESNYYNRTNAAQNFATTKMNDYWAPLYPSSQSQLQNASTDTVKWIPFGVTNVNSVYIDSAAYSQVAGTVPAVGWFIGQFTESVAKTNNDLSQQVVLYPNPATDVINAKVNMANGNAVNHIAVIDGVGRTIYRKDVDHVRQGNIALPVNGFVPGTYYMILGTDAASMSRTFTVSGK